MIHYQDGIKKSFVNRKWGMACYISDRMSQYSKIKDINNSSSWSKEEIDFLVNTFPSTITKMLDTPIENEIEVPDHGIIDIYIDFPCITIVFVKDDLTETAWHRTFNFDNKNMIEKSSSDKINNLIHKFVLEFNEFGVYVASLRSLEKSETSITISKLGVILGGTGLVVGFTGLMLGILSIIMIK